MFGEPADGHEAEAAGLLGGGRYRYAGWDGRQRLPDLDADDVLGAVADDLLTEGDVSAALARLFRRGLRPADGTSDRLPGLAELRRRLAEARQQALARYELGDVLADVRRELDELLKVEQRGIERRLAGANGVPGDPEAGLRGLAADLAARRQAELDALPADPGGQIRRLQDYDFLEPEARERFAALLERLQKQMLDSYFDGLAEAIRDVTPEQLAQNREMVRELNQLLQERLAGAEPDVSGFLERHGAFFPGARTLDDVIEQLARRMAAMQSMMASLGSDQRRQLHELMDSLLRDDRLRWDLAQLAGTLDQLLPDGLGQRFDFHGPENLSLEGALQQLGRLSAMERMSAQLGDVASPAELEQIDPDEIGRLLDPAAADDLRALQRLASRLEEAGYVERAGDRLRLTPRGTRRLGQGVLDELFGRLQRDVFGGHRRRAGGGSGERTESSRAYEFGRPFDLDLQRTLANALARAENVPAGRVGSPRRLHMAPSDFEVHELEETTRVATVLLLDMSRSMLLRGCFLAAKKVAMALDMLIRTQFPRDELRIVGFAYYAREIKPSALAALSWHGYEYGTNLQHGLAVARQLLARSRTANREIVVITDGEPTAHFENGQVEFSYPPTRQTILQTLREVGQCTREGITINTFMLERSRALTAFVDRMTRQNRGRAFYATPERLGEYVLVDYVDRRSRST